MYTDWMWFSSVLFCSVLSRDIFTHGMQMLRSTYKHIVLVPLQAGNKIPLVAAMVTCHGDVLHVVSSLSSLTCHQLDLPPTCTKSPPKRRANPASLKFETCRIGGKSHASSLLHLGLGFSLKYTLLLLKSPSPQIGPVLAPGRSYRLG